MKKSRLFGAVCVCLAAVSFKAGASLVSADLNSTGDGLLTVDTGTGLEWLDVTQTLNQSYNSVIGGYNGYTTTSGFRYATAVEVTTFFTNAGIPIIDQTTSSNYQASNVSPANTLISLIGTGSSSFMDAIINDVITSGVHRVAIIQGIPNLASATETYVCTQCGTWGDSSVDSAIGSFLVRPTISQVPVPAAVWLFGSGLLGLVGMARRKKA